MWLTPDFFAWWVLRDQMYQDTYNFLLFMWVSVHCEGDLFQMARMSCESSSCTTKETCLQGIHNLNHSGVESFCCKKKTAIFFLNTILFPPPSFSFKERQWCPNSGRLSTCPWFIYANLRNGFSHVFHRSV